MAGEARINQENDLIVADYFAMLRDDLAGRPVNKAEHNQHLQSRIARGLRSLWLIVTCQRISSTLTSLMCEPTWYSTSSPT